MRARLAQAHDNFGFDAAGTYTVTFNVTGTLVGGGTISSGSKQFTIQVLNSWTLLPKMGPPCSRSRWAHLLKVGETYNAD